MSELTPYGLGELRSLAAEYRRIAAVFKSKSRNPDLHQQTQIRCGVKSDAFHHCAERLEALLDKLADSQGFD